MKNLKQIMIVWCCIFLTTVYAEEHGETDLGTYLDINNYALPQFIEAWNIAQKSEGIERSEENNKIFELAEKIKKISSCSDCSLSEKKFFINVLNLLNNPELFYSSSRHIQRQLRKIITPDLMERYNIPEYECVLTEESRCERAHRRRVLGTIMIDAIKTNRQQLVELLLDVDFVIIGHYFNTRNFSALRGRPEYRVPLFFAIAAGNKEIVQMLLNKGADITIKNYNGDTPLKFAEEKGNTEIVEMLKKALADKLFEAVKAGNKELVQSLIDSGADVDAKNSYGDTVLFIAERNAAEPNGSTEIVEMLKKAGAK